MFPGLFAARTAASIGMVLLLVGCTPQVELAYTPREELKEFPAKQRQQIVEGLETYFGTPRFPKFMLVAPAEKQPADAKEPLLVEKLERAHLRHGREVYARQCSGCHGTTGDGQGPAAAYLNPPPRDYRLGRFKFTDRKSTRLNSSHRT